MSIEDDRAASISCPICCAKIALTGGVARKNEPKPAKRVAAEDAPPVVELEYTADAPPSRTGSFEDEPVARPRRETRDRAPAAKGRGGARAKKNAFPMAVVLSVVATAVLFVAGGLAIYFVSQPAKPANGPVSAVREEVKPAMKPKVVPPAVAEPRVEIAKSEPKRAVTEEIAPRPTVPQPIAPSPAAPAVKAPAIMFIDSGFVVPQVSPENQEKTFREQLASHRKTLGAAYDRIGMKNPKWDDEARKALEAAAIVSTVRHAGKFTWLTVREHSQRAMDAGCADPLIRFLNAHSYKTDDAESIARRVDAGLGLGKSAYPIVRRVEAFHLAAENQVLQGKQDPAARREAEKSFQAGIDLLPKLPKDDDGDLRRFLLNQTLSDAANLQIEMSRDVPRVIQWLESKIGDDPEIRAAGLTTRSRIMQQFGWAARGDGMANTVTDEGWRLFGERLLDAKNSLEAAWRLNPKDAQIAAQMIHALKAIGKGDEDEVRKWFNLGMQADPDNYDVCKQLLGYLDPKWHGSKEHMVGFGFACRDSNNARSRIPLLVAEAHFMATQRQPMSERAAYMATDAVWKDVRTVYDDYLKVAPADEYRRFEFAIYCGLCSRYVLAGEHFNRIGANVYKVGIVSDLAVRQIRDRALSERKNYYEKKNKLVSERQD